MTKLTVATVIIVTFVAYSFLHTLTGGAALAPQVSDATSTAVSSPPPVAAGPAPSPTTIPVTPEPTTAPTPVPTALPTARSTAAATSPATAPPTTISAGGYKDGSYTGAVADAQWGDLQVKAIITDGKISDVQFLQYPSDRSRSVSINRVADPRLRSEAIQAQSAKVDVVTGATDSSIAFRESLADALRQAQS